MTLSTRSLLAALLGTAVAISPPINPDNTPAVPPAVPTPTIFPPPFDGPGPAKPDANQRIRFPGGGSGGGGRTGGSSGGDDDDDSWTDIFDRGVEKRQRFGDIDGLFKLPPSGDDDSADVKKRQRFGNIGRIGGSDNQGDVDDDDDSWTDIFDRSVDSQGPSNNIDHIDPIIPIPRIPTPPAPAQSSESGTASGDSASQTAEPLPNRGGAGEGIIPDWVKGLGKGADGAGNEGQNEEINGDEDLENGAQPQGDASQTTESASIQPSGSPTTLSVSVISAPPQAQQGGEKEARDNHIFTTHSFVN